MLGNRLVHITVMHKRYLKGNGNSKFPIVAHVIPAYICVGITQFVLMKKALPCISILLSLLLSTTTSFSQVSVVSNNGYTVNIVLQPKEIVPTSSTCVNGYNYNVKMDYSVTFTGSNIPSSLYTLQGTLGCGTSSHFFDLPNNGGAGSVTSTSNVWRSTSDCSTATISSLNCTVVNIQINGPGISNRTVTFNASPTVLPVKIISFNAEALKDKVKLTWATATEINNDYFSIERSVDGINWTVVKTIKGAGNSSIVNNYECIDQNPVASTALYRLKQTDLDGQSTYSDTRSVKFTGIVHITVFPVPNSGNTISLAGMAEPKNWTMTVRNASGVTVYGTTLSSNTVQLPSLKPGLFIISLVNKITGETTTLRYIKI